MIEYPIVYHLNGGTNSIANPETYTIEQEVHLQAPERKGYDFTGWLDSDVISKGNVGEFNACYMNKETLEKIITAESINISLRGSKGKLDYTIPKQEKWQKMLEY